MALKLIINIVILFVLNSNIIQARAPGLYYPIITARNGENEAYDHASKQIRSNLDNQLTPLTENELETLLYLLDKVQQKPVPKFKDQRINKRTGYHFNNYPMMAAAKRSKTQSNDWSNYFGIDKREIKIQPGDIPSGLTAKETQVKVVAPTTASDDAATKEKQREKEILKEFYQNMAMSANVKKRKRRETASPLKNNAGVDSELNSIGNKLITDTMKLIGKYRDVKLNPIEFDNLKKQLIQRIETAYSVEKLREVLNGAQDIHGDVVANNKIFKQ